MKGVHQLQNTIEISVCRTRQCAGQHAQHPTNRVCAGWLADAVSHGASCFPGAFHGCMSCTMPFSLRGCGASVDDLRGFQIAVLRAFARGKTEADYPDDGLG